MYHSFAALSTAGQAQAAEQVASTNPLISIAAFLLMLFILVVVHELGHFLTAVWMGIKVEEFGIGYPPRAATLFERNGVKYTLNWLPLGGFVRFATNEGEQDSLYGVGSLQQATPWRKILVMVAGPLMNLVLAIAIFAGLFMIMGVPQPTGTQTLGTVYPDTPAARAGLQAGDLLISLDGQLVSDSRVVVEAGQNNSGRPIIARVSRAGQELDLTVTPGRWTTASGEVVEAGFGFGYSPTVAYGQAGPIEAIVAGTAYTWDLLGQMLRGLASLPGAIAGMFAPDNNGNSPIGPVGIARATGEVLQQEGGLLAFFNLTAVLSLNLFLLNLLPIPALDGSHIVFSIIEWLRGGKKLPPEREAIVHAVGFAALMGLMLLITVSDVIKAFSGTPVLGN
jgi:regulator of sigma E protease